MAYFAKFRGAPVSPRKARLVVDMIRGKDLGAALAVLKFAPQRAAKMLFKVVMAYDNDWAYHFIEDTFDDKGAKDKFSYPENLYRAYYEENGPSRFLPLIDKYGKKPFDW